MQQDYTIPDLNNASGFWMVFILLEKNFYRLIKFIVHITNSLAKKHSTYNNFHFQNLKPTNLNTT